MNHQSTHCMGTRRVVLLKDVDPLAPYGLLIVHRFTAEDPADGDTEVDSSPASLLVQVCTDDTVYEQKILMEEVRLTDKTQLLNYLLQDGNKHPDVTVRLEYEAEGSSLKLTVQQSLASSGLKKFVYKGSLAKIDAKFSVLQAALDLGESINASQEKIQSLEQQVQEKDKELQQWKETATYLDKNVWQNEKDRLVNQFLKLFNERQRRAKEQFKELQDELELTRAALATAQKKGKRPRALHLDEDIANADDDLATKAGPIPMSQVEALAAGRRVQPETVTSRERILGPNDAVSASELHKQAEDYAKRKQTKKASQKKNVHEEDEGETTAAPRKRRKLAKSADSESQDDPDLKKPAPSAGKIEKSSSQTESDKGSPIIHLDADQEALRDKIRAALQRGLSSDEETDVPMDRKKDYLSDGSF